MAATDIEWATKVWNFVRGCRRVSPGCGGAKGVGGCYAEKTAYRFSGTGQPYEGLVTLGTSGPRWNGVGRFVPEKLGEPLRWRAPRDGSRHRIFVNSMSDLFFEEFSNEQIAAGFGAMAACSHHDLLILTKRPRRAAEWFAWLDNLARQVEGGDGHVRICLRLAYEHGLVWSKHIVYPTWPLPGVWLGVSAENQDTYNERVPVLVHQCPAALHWVSLEPQLGPIRLRGTGHIPLGWVVQGGESGPGARPFHEEWARSMRIECAELGIPYFLKQLGGNHFAPWKVEWTKRLDGSFDAFSSDGAGVRGTNLATVWPNGTWHTWDANGIGGENSQTLGVETAKGAALEALQRQHISPIKGWARHKHMLKNRKGNDMQEWPSDLRCREFPEARP
jgi:protein gp37